ncbi:uncharacterized protein LOC103505929 [Diaphorina citri]|uniref:Uncharacterized protein LOC103505929 n=1 Tax=Diaphorina citri TaxID=121845 RepID=A0A1S3CVA2_DIACI|nr:uncharacterized protein LOC103505929 [Diaphorina citri]
MRATIPEFFCDRNFKTGTMQSVQDVVKFCILPNRTAKGWAVLMGKLDNYDASQLHLDSAIKLLFMHLDSFLLAHPLVPGIIFMFDMQGTSLSHLTRINLSLVRKYLTYVQEAMPLRLKEIRIINVNNVISHIMNLIKPFIHKNHLQYVSITSKNAFCSEISELAINQLADCSNMFDDEERLLSQLNKNFKKSKTNVTIEGSFKKLDLD